MIDNLTKELQSELKRRGKAASLTQISDALNDLNLGASPKSPTPSGQPMQYGGGGLPDWANIEVQQESGDALNAVGAALWSFADTALFGVPGLFVDEEKYIDFDDPWAKWTSAIGGFTGFVAGAPMKIGAKGVGWLAGKAIPKARALQHVDEVVKGMATVGRKRGLQDETITQVTGGYRALVKHAQINKNLKGTEFATKAENYLNNYVNTALMNKRITELEARNIKAMFTENVFKRPIQDFYGIVAERGIFASSPRAQRVLGHAINDSIMFGLIDTVFEGVGTIEDHEFDWTAPMWGVATGAAFSQLSWLKPRGNAASWKKDFLQGAKAAFARKDLYGKATLPQLEATARFFGETAKKARGALDDDAPKTWVKTAVLGDKKITVDLTSPGLMEKLNKEFGGANAKKVLQNLLEKEKRDYGKLLMKYANGQAASNLSEVWPRMIMGGALFNLHSFYDMAFNGVEMGMHELLPHFLIGAWVQRHSNPRTFDFTKNNINQVRANLMHLGMGPGQLHHIPTFDYKESALNSPFRDAEMAKILDRAREMGLVGDDAEVVNRPLPKGEQSLGMEGNQNPKFEQIYAKLKNHGEDKYVRELENVSVKEGNELIKLLEEIDPEMKGADSEVIGRRLEKATLAATKDFEQRFVDVIEQVESLDRDGELGITKYENEDNKGRVPQHVYISPKLEKLARDGKLEILGQDAEGKNLEKDAAIEALYAKIESFNSILTTAQLIDMKQHNPNKKERTKDIKSLELLEGIIKSVNEAEFSVQEMYPENRHFVEKFNFRDSFNDYVEIMSRNTALRVAENVREIFSPNYGDRPELMNHLREVDLLTFPQGQLNGVLRQDLKNIKFEDGISDVELASNRRLLGRVLAIQGVSGGYGVVQEAPQSNHVVKQGAIKALEKFLNDRGYKVKTSLDKDWMHARIIDYVISDRVSKTKLKVDDVDIMFKLSEVNMVNFEASQEGKIPGFQIKKIDITSLDKKDSRYEDAQKYNTFVDKVIRKGGDELVTLVQGEVFIHDHALMDAISQRMMTEGKSMQATAVLTKFMGLLPTLSTTHAKMEKQIGAFLDHPLGMDRMMTWLAAAGVVKRDERSTVKGAFSVDMKKLNEKIKDKENADFGKTHAEVIQARMEEYGFDNKYSNQRYHEIDQAARDRLLTDISERDGSNHMTIQEFWKKYRWGHADNDYTGRGSESQGQKFQEHMYDPTAELTDRVLTKGVIEHFLSHIYVENSNGDWVKLATSTKETMAAYDAGEPFIKPKERVKFAEQAFDDLTSLLAKQHAQVKVDKIEYKNGRITKDSDVVQFSRYDALMKRFDVPFMIIDPLAPIYENVDGRYIRMRHVDIFTADAENLGKTELSQIKAHRTEFERLMNVKTELNGEKVEGDGIAVMQIGKDVDAIAIEKGHLKNLNPQFEEFLKRHQDNKNISDITRRKWKKILDKMGEEKEVVTMDEYEDVLRTMTYEEMLRGEEGTQFFEEYLKGTDKTGKIAGRIKLFHTKKFARFDRNYVRELASGNRLVGRKGVAKLLDSLVKKNGFGVSIWNDEHVSNLVRTEVEKQLKEAGILKSQWSWDSDMGGAYSGTSTHDSISFVSRITMAYAHSVLGHHPMSTNPLKPVITSGGSDAPLLLGKTLLVYAPSMEGFFKNNPNIDILLSKSGAKAFNGKVNTETGNDDTLINRPWSYISGKRTGRSIGEGRVRKIPLEALGIKPDADKGFVPASMGQSDYNYANNQESGRLFNTLYEPKLAQNLEFAKTIASDPIGLRRMILKETFDEGIVPDLASNEGLSHINNMAWFSSFTRDANPMSYSPNMTKNKAYSMFINSLINNFKSSWSQSDPDNSERFGGQSIIIQAAEPGQRLKPTIVDKRGKMLMRGEVMLPFHEMFMNLGSLNEKGFTIRFVKGENVYNVDQVLEQFEAKYNMKTGPKDWRPGGKHYKKFISDLTESLSTKTLGEVYENINNAGLDLQIGIIVNRKPRTRPNDLALMGLKGFLKKDYGNSIQLSSLDIVNVFEGDYDVDKADYFFTHKPDMYNHIHRTSQFWVNGVDPSIFVRPQTFDFTANSSIVNEKWRKMVANANAFKSNIGIVQKVPRALGALSKIGSTVKKGDEFMANYMSTTKIVDENGVLKEVESSPRILMGDGTKGDDYRIFLDFENTDYFTRAALETQYIIDGDNQVNPDISRNLRTWRDDFLFPRFDDSVPPGEVRKEGMGFVNQMRAHGKSNTGKRVRIFRKVIRDPKSGVISEVELNPLEKAVIKEMLGQYNSLLNATGKTLWENSGEQRAPKFDDVIDAGEDYRSFMNNLSDGIYYKLRNRFIPGTEKKWKTDADFRKLFGEEKSTFKNEYGKKQTYFKPTKKIHDTTVHQNAQKVASGDRGAVIDRIIMRVLEKDIFEQTRAKGMTGEIRELMDTWYGQLFEGTHKQHMESIDYLNSEIVSGAFDHNQKVKLIRSLKKKTAQIGNNFKVPYKTRNASQNKLNKLIRKLEGELSKELIPKEYWKTKKGKDLELFKFVSLEAEDLKEGAIQYATINNLQEFLPNVGKLNKQARVDLAQVKLLRKLFYSNKTNLGDVLEYGDKAILNRETREFLARFPDLSSFYDIEHAYLTEGWIKHGNGWILEFMKPAQDKYSIGLFNGVPHSVPYSKSLRYKRGLQWMTKMAVQGKMDEQIQRHSLEERKAPEVLREILQRNVEVLQTFEAQYERYFNRKFDMKNMIGENLSDSFNITAEVDAMGSSRAVTLGDVKLPDLNEDVKKSLTSFRRIKWSREKNRISQGYDLMNDHWMDFYNNLAIISGRQEQFVKYREEMNDLNAMMTKNHFIDPVDYLQRRYKIDQEMRDLAQTVLSNPDLMDSDSQNIRNIKNNPVWAIMGGGNAYKGISLEKNATLNPNRLRELTKMYDKLEEYKENINAKTEKKSSEELDDIIKHCSKKMDL